MHWISDLRELNKVLIRNQCPLPIIGDVLKKSIGYKFFTKLDITTQYYMLELDDESANACTIVTPFGKFKYRRMPMGLKCAPDFAQEVMKNVLRGLEDIEVDVYLDNVGCFSNSWNQHVKLLDKVLYRLKSNGFTVNPRKCKFAV